MIKNKKVLLPIALFIALGLVMGAHWITSDSGNQIALAAATNIDNLDLEYIKIKTPDGHSEHWRDLKNLEERADTYDAKGNIVNKIIVKDNGKRVISIGFENGKPEALTWVLPDNISNINKDNLSKSLLQEVKNELHKQKWQDKGLAKLADGKTVRKIESTFEDAIEVVYIDESTSFPVKRELYKKQNNQLRLLETRTEEYKKVSGNSGEIFNHNGVELKEIPAPVVGDPNAAKG